MGVIAEALLSRAAELDAEAKRLKMPEGSTPHMCANVWRTAAGIAKSLEAEQKIAAESLHANLRSAVILLERGGNRLRSAMERVAQPPD
jgi:hypothetical protein